MNIEKFLTFLEQAQQIVEKHRKEYEGVYEMKGGWSGIRDLVESAASIGGNYLLPGSSIVTSPFMSKGSQKQLNSPIGRIANLAGALTGSGALQSLGGSLGSSALSSIPTASSFGGGWGNLLSGVGKFASNIGLGTTAGSPLVNGVGATQGSGIAGALTRTGADIASPSSGGLFSNLLGGGGNSSYAPLAAIGGGITSYMANQQATDQLKKAQQQAAGVMQPYLNSGNAANSALGVGLGLGGNVNAPNYGALTKQFSMNDFNSDPGYQFRLQQGQQALDRQQASRGGYFSGAALKEGQNFAQGLADQTYQDAYNRYVQNQNNLYNKLASQSNLGATEANNLGQIYANIGSANAANTVKNNDIFNSTLSSLLGGNRLNYKQFLS